MLSRVRGLMENWIARGFFALLILVFVFWGISNVFSLAGSSTTVAHAGGQAIDITAVQAEYQRALNQTQQTSPAPDASARQQLAGNALFTVIHQRLLEQFEHASGIAVPDAVLRQKIYAIPDFQSNGVFDKTRFAAVLQANNLSADEFIGLIKQDLASSQVMQAVVSGVAAPQVLVDQVFAYATQQRFAETVDFPVSAIATPPLPADAVLQRYWRNHPAAFTAPEYRSVKIVILSPALLAAHQPVSAAELQAAYAQAAAGQTQPATRSVQVITAPDLATAQKLRLTWNAATDWGKIQTAAAAQNATAVELDQATAAQFPDASLAAAVFAAPVNTVTGPLPGTAGYFILKVIAANPGGAPSLAALAPQLTQQIQLQKAQNAVNQDVDNVQDALAGATPLDRLPGNLGLVAVQGTLDANGNTTTGDPAPIPAAVDLRKAIIAAAFAAHPGDPAQLITGPDNAYFALTVDSITPPALQPYDQVKAAVAAAWTADATARAAEVKAASLLAAVNAGQSLDAAASAAGYAVAAIPPVTRSAPAPGSADGIGSKLQQILFSLQPGQATMLQTPTGFTVAALTRIGQPTPATDPRDAASIADAMTKTLQRDTADSFAAGLQARGNVRIDQKLFAQIYQ